MIINSSKSKAQSLDLNFFDIRYTKLKKRYKRSFIRSYLDYLDLVCNQSNYESVQQRIVSVKKVATLEITGVIKGTSKTKLYKEIYLEHICLEVIF